MCDSSMKLRVRSHGAGTVIYSQQAKKRNMRHFAGVIILAIHGAAFQGYR